MKPIHGKRQRLFRMQILILVSLLLLLVVGVISVDQYIQRTFLSVKDQIFRQIEERYKIKIGYQEVSPSFLSSFRVKNLVVESTAIEGPWLLTCESLRIIVNPLAFFSPEFSDNPEIIIRKVVIRRGSLIVKVIPKGRDTSEILSSLLSGLKFPYFDISLHNFDFVVQTDYVDGTISINRLNVKSEKEQVRLNWRIDGDLKIPSEKSPVRNLLFSNKTSGIASHNGTFFDFDTRFGELSTESMVFKPLKFNVVLRDKEIDLRKIEDDQPFDLVGSYSLDTAVLSGHFNSEDWAPGSLFQFIPGKDPGIGDFLGSKITCMANLSTDIDFNTPVYDYTGDIVLSHPLIKGKASLGSRFSGDIDLIDFEEIVLKTDWGNAYFDGIFSLKDLAPRGRLEFKNVATPFKYKLNSVFDLTYDDNAILVDSIVFSAGKIKVEDVRLLILKGNKDLNATLQIKLEEGEEVWADLARVSKDGAFHGWNFNLELINIPGDKIARLLSVDEELAKRLSESRLNAFADGWLASGGSIQARLHKFIIALPGEKPRSLEMKGSLTNHNFNIDSAILTLGSEKIEAQCQGLIDSKGFRMKSLVYYHDNPYGFQATYAGGKSLLIQGDHGINGTITSTPGGKYFFYMSFDELPVPVSPGEVYISCHLSGYYKDQKDWQVLVKNGEWHFIRGSYIPDSRLLTTFRVSPDLIDLYSISFKDKYSSVKGFGQFRVNDWEKRDFIGWFRAQDPEKGEIYRGSIISESDKLSGDIVINHFPLARIDKLKMNGTATSRIRLSGTWKNPEIDGSIITHSMKYGNRPGRVSADFSYKEDLVQISSLDCLLGDLSVEKGLFQLDRRGKTLIASGGIAYNHYNSVLSGRFSAGFDLDHTQLDKLLEQDKLRGRLFLSDLIWDGERAFPEQYFTLIKEPDFISIKENKSNSADFFYNSRTRNYEFFLGNPWPLTFNSRGRITGGVIDGVVDNIVLHFPVLNYLMLKDLYLKDYYVVFKEGKAQGNLVITGDLADPQIYGTLEVSNLLVDTPFTYSTIGKTNCTIQLFDKEIVVEPFDIPVGEGIITADAHFEMDHWIPSEYVINTQSQGKGRNKGVQACYPLPYVDFDGIFTGDIKITGNRVGAHIEGDAIFHKLTITPGALIEPLSVPRVDYPYRLTTDLRFETGQNVVFYLPDKRNRIIEAVVNPGESLSVKIDTLTQIILLNGLLTLKTGEVNYFGKAFKLTEGSLTFNEDQNKFDPYLSVEAEVRTHDSEGEEVVISMLYDAPLSILLTSFEPRFSSIPSKSQNEILTMLGQSFIPYDVQQKDWGAVPIRIAGDYFIEPNVIRPVEDVLKESLGFDMISIRTNIVENALLDRIFFNEYYLNTDYNFSLGRYLDNTSFYVGQYLGKNLFFSGSLKFKYTEEMQENPLLNNLNLDTVFNFGLELKTPLLIINWNYSPGLSDENFVADNQITLKWKFQF